MSFNKYWDHEKFEILREILVSVIVAALVASLFNFYADNKIDQKTSQRQLAYDFSRTFFDNPKYRNVSIAVEEQYIDGRGNVWTGRNGPFDDYVIDDYLGLLNDIWTYDNEGLAPEHFVEDQFDYYFCITYHNADIQAYRSYLHETGYTPEAAWGYLEDVAKKYDFKNSDCRNF
jgi:hypothetical protein